MNARLRTFAGLALVSLAIAIGLMVHIFLNDDSARLADLGLYGGLLLLDLPLILLAAANLRWAQMAYVGLFFFGIVHRIGEVGSLLKADGGSGLLVVAALGLQIAGVIVLIREVRDQRAAEKLGAGSLPLRS